MSYKCCLAYSSSVVEVKNFISFQMLQFGYKYHSAISACYTSAHEIQGAAGKSAQNPLGSH